MLRNLIDGTEPGAAGVAALAQRALALRGGASPTRHDGKRLAAVFLNSSLRTRASMEAACRRAVALGLPSVAFTEHLDSTGLCQSRRAFDQKVAIGQQCDKQCRENFIFSWIY